MNKVLTAVLRQDPPFALTMWEVWEAVEFTKPYIKHKVTRPSGGLSVRVASPKKQW